MSNFQIVTDSCCDLTGELLRRNDVACAPLSVLCNGSLHEGTTETDTAKDLYNAIRAGAMPTTSAVNPEGWAKAMEPALKEGKDVLCICFSSGLSTTYQSAVIAAEDLKDQYPGRTIRVIDSLCAALGQGLLVWHACRHRDAGESLEQVAQWVEDNKLNVCHWVTVDDLSHLKRGGRISATTALVGTMLNVKPIIHVDNDGHLINLAKVRGRKAAMEYLVKKFGETATDFDNVFIAHGDCPEDAAALEAMLREKHDIKNVTIGYVGPVIGAHTGPGVLVLFFMGTKR